MCRAPARPTTTVTARHVSRQGRGPAMIKVKTFSTPLKIFAVAQELEELDRDVAAFLSAEGARTVYAMSDSATTGDSGETIGLVRSVIYEVD